MSDIIIDEIYKALDNARELTQKMMTEKDFRIKSLLSDVESLEKEREELREENEKLEQNDTTDEINFNDLDLVSFKYKTQNLWVEQIMESIEKIVELKGTKYLMDRLNITVKSITV